MNQKESFFEEKMIKIYFHFLFYFLILCKQIYIFKILLNLNYILIFFFKKDIFRENNRKKKNENLFNLMYFLFHIFTFYAKSYLIR
jgi:hypothetical protein